MTDAVQKKCPWTGAPWERDAPRRPGDQDRCGAEVRPKATYCPVHAAIAARYLRHRDKGPELIELRSCAADLCEHQFEWSSWGQDRQYCSEDCKDQKELADRKLRRAAKQEAARVACEALTHKACAGGPKRKGCGQLKPIEDFRSLRGHVSSLCSVCLAEWNATYESQRAPVRAANYRQNARELTAVQYGLSPEQFDDVVRRSEGRCEICGQQLRDLDTDHDGVTGHVRGLLCGNHNMGLGKFAHDVGLLRAAIAYLENEAVFVVPAHPVRTRMCQDCGLQPKLPGRGQRYCARCAVVCRACRELAVEGQSLCARCHANGETVRRRRKADQGPKFVMEKMTPGAGSGPDGS